MRTFDEILAEATGRFGESGVETRLAALPNVSLASMSDDRLLSAMARCIFASGFSEAIVAERWPGFEEAFEGFAPVRVAVLDEPDVERLMRDDRIVRNAPKIDAVIRNARFMLETASAHQSFGRFLLGWPQDDQYGLQDRLTANGARLEGVTGQSFLLAGGWDAFVVTDGVTRALDAEGVFEKAPAGAAARKAIQDAFNAWSADSGRQRREVCAVLEMLGQSPARR